MKGFNQKKGWFLKKYCHSGEDVVRLRGAWLDCNYEHKIKQVNTAFLHSDLEEEIYMEKLEGIQVNGKEDLICQLKKSLYGLKQAPR